MKKLRAQQISIDLPTEEGEVWLNATLQTIVKDQDYKTVQRIDRTEQTHRKLSDVATQVEQMYDPVTGQTLNVSGYGVALLIKMFVVSWMQQDHGGEINEIGDLITEE